MNLVTIKVYVKNHWVPDYITNSDTNRVKMLSWKLILKNKRSVDQYTTYN